jgi:hypothetical protein
MPGVNIADLDPDHHRGPGRAGRVPGDPELSLAREEHQPGIIRPGRAPGKSPGPAGHGRSGGCGPGRRGAAGSGCSERPRHHSSITLSDTGGLTRTRTLPPICIPGLCSAVPSDDAQRGVICIRLHAPGSAAPPAKLLRGRVRWRVNGLCR